MFRGATQSALALENYFGSDVTCKAATLYQYPLLMHGDHFNAIFSYYLSFNDGSIYKMDLNLTFKFNFTISHYDFTSITLDSSLIYTSPSPITYLCITNGMLMMQSNSTGQTYIFNTNSNSLGTVSGIPLNQTFNFFYINSTYYILQSTGLVKLTYNSISNSMGMSFVTSQLPYNTYALNFGSAFDPFYIPGMPYLYKASSCSGNSQMVGSVCVNYSCSVVNCLSCPINSALCSTCNGGFSLSTNLCSPIIITPTFNTFNITNNSNTNPQAYFYTDSNPFLQLSFFN